MRYVRYEGRCASALCVIEPLTSAQGALCVMSPPPPVQRCVIAEVCITVRYDVRYGALCVMDPPAHVRYALWTLPPITLHGAEPRRVSPSCIIQL